MTTPLTDDLAALSEGLDAPTRAWLTNAVLESAAALDAPQRSMRPPAPPAKKRSPART
ncbi:hypothetical protein ABT150_53370 [Streptomyces mirabilis]|uniref:hypothetical protein n=1 Tax=Streptomyces mirabilis TaxID=68239 RepID=UPI0033208F8C